MPLTKITGSDFDETNNSGLIVSGIVTATSLLLNNQTLTGTASQPLQVNGGAYVSGSVGIGTTNPSERIHSRTSGTTSYIRLDNSSGIRAYYGVNSSQDIEVNAADNTNLVFKTFGTERARITSAGNLGIGTTNPAGFNGACDDIVVSGASDVGMTFYSTSTTGSGNIAFTRGSVSGNTHGAINYNHTSDYMIFQTNLGEKMRIDSVGRVTKPNQPGFLAAKNNSEQTAAGTIVFNTVSTNGGHNIGNHYSTTTGTFTAPIAGRYVFMCSIHATNGNFKVDTRLRINGSDSPGGFALNNVDSYTQATGCVILNLAANDAVTIYHVAGGVWPDANLTYFSGYLLG